MRKDKFVEQRLISVVPSRRQIAHQRREFYGFVHFTVNTFTGKEWGDGTEDEAIFNPVKMDADQWCDALCAAEGPDNDERESTDQQNATQRKAPHSL